VVEGHAWSAFRCKVPKGRSPYYRRQLEHRRRDDCRGRGYCRGGRLASRNAVYCN
jgi:hypothetical protein